MKSVTIGKSSTDRALIGGRNKQKDTILNKDAAVFIPKMSAEDKENLKKRNAAMEAYQEKDAQVNIYICYYIS